MTGRFVRSALVTGAGSGIGRACAIALAAEGFSLALLGRKSLAIEETASTITHGGGNAITLPANVADEPAVEAALATTVDHFGRLDLLFNNAGTSAPKAALDDVELRHFERVLATNVTGAFLCARAAFRQMRAQDPQGGRIINNGSVSAHVPRPNGTPYTVSKHAITGLTRQIALDGRRYAIACSQIDIGNADTGVAATLQSGMEQPDGRVMPEPVMPLQSVTDAIVLMAKLPLSTNIQFMTVLATKMPFIGRG